MIYFVTNGCHVKIGYASNPKTRVSDLQVGSPVSLTVLLVTDGNRSDERRIHEQFSADRVRGEWFMYSSTIKEYIDSNLMVDRRYELGLTDEDFTSSQQIKRVRKQGGMSMQQFAEKMGVRQQRVSRIESDERNGSITIKTAQRCAEALGCVFEYRFRKKKCS